ncbi:hypothetical protein F5Y04DRAFT_293521 [Hypomontagnella monticulosa]|nr:hypothetical protein F5Y04DRAFT_293521 [Hypomontagnella monticulosa]
MVTRRDVPNLGPNLMVAIWICCLLAGAFMSLRLYCKFKRRVSLGFDDYLLIASWTVEATCSILVSIDVAAGFGMYTDDIIAKYGPENLVPINLRETIVGFLMTLACAWSKTSFAVTVLRIAQGKMKTFLWSIIITMNVFMTIGALSLFLRCSPVVKSWDEHISGKCWPTFTMVAGMFSAVYSALMDFVLALLPWPLIWHLKMKTKEKIGVAIAMSMGICAGTTGIVKCYYLQRPHGIEFFYEGGYLVIWGTAEVATTIMAASIPVLRVLLRDFRDSVAWYRHSTSFKDALRSLGRKPRRESHQNPNARQKPTTPCASNDAESDEIAFNRMSFGGITLIQEVHIRFDDRIDVDDLRHDTETPAYRILPV